MVAPTGRLFSAALLFPWMGRLACEGDLELVKAGWGRTPGGLVRANLSGPEVFGAGPRSLLELNRHSAREVGRGSRVEIAEPTSKVPSFSRLDHGLNRIGHGGHVYIDAHGSIASAHLDLGDKATDHSP